MKQSLRKSFSYGRRKKRLEDDHLNPRIDSHAFSSSNSNLVKSNQSKSFLRRRRRYSSSPPPPESSPDATNLKSSDHGFNNHMTYNHDDDGCDYDEDDPFSSPSNKKTRMRPFDRLTDQIRRSFRNTLIRQRPRLESNNSNKRLLLKKHDENLLAETNLLPLSMGLTSPLVSPTQEASLNQNEKTKISPKRKKAPLAPTHIPQSVSVPNPDCSKLSMTQYPELECVATLNDQQQNSSIKKSKSNQSFRTRLSLLLKKRHAKQHVQIQNCNDEDVDHQYQGDHEELNHKKLTLSQRFNTLRRSFHLGNHNSKSKGQRHLLSNE